MEEIIIEQENAKQLQVIEAVKNFRPEFISVCYAVGEWIWADFQEQRLSQEEVNFLKGIGFRWNKARKLWQNACGVKTRHSTGDPRLKYQVVKFGED